MSKDPYLADSHGSAFQPVLTMRARVDEVQVASFTRRALREIRSYVNQQGREVDGPPFSISHPLPHHRVDVEAGWPASGVPDHGDIHCGALPVSQLRRTHQ